MRWRGQDDHVCEAAKWPQVSIWIEAVHELTTHTSPEARRLQQDGQKPRPANHAHAGMCVLEHPGVCVCQSGNCVHALPSSERIRGQGACSCMGIVGADARNGRKWRTQTPQTNTYKVPPRGATQLHTSKTNRESKNSPTRPHTAPHDHTKPHTTTQSPT